MNYSIHYATPNDLPAIARVHMQAFPASLATAMGQKYVEKMLSWFLSTNKTFMFYVLDSDNQVAGYCGGMVKDGTLSTGSASGMLQHSFNEAVRSMMMRPWLIFHKEMRQRYGFMLSNIMRKVMRKSQYNAPATVSKPATGEASTGLVSIGVQPKYFGKGIGHLLLQEFERKTAELGVPHMYLSVNASNAQAIKSYERSGWIKERVSGKSLRMFKYIRSQP